MISQKELSQVIKLRTIYATKLTEVKEALTQLEKVEKSILTRLYYKYMVERGQFLPKIKYSKMLKYINWKREFRTKFPEFYTNIKDSVGYENLVKLNLKSKGLSVSGEHEYALEDITKTKPNNG